MLESDSVKSLPTTHKVLGLLPELGEREKSTLRRHTPITSAKAEDQRWRQEREKLRVNLELRYKSSVMLSIVLKTVQPGYSVAILKETQKHSPPTQNSTGLV